MTTTTLLAAKVTLLEAKTTPMAAIDLELGSHKALVTGTVILIAVSLLGGFGRAAFVFFHGRLGEAYKWCAGAIVISVIIASGAGIWMSVKKTADKTQITTGQYGE